MQSGYKVHGPIGSLADRDITYGEISHIGECEHVRARVKCRIGERFQFIGIANLRTHKTDAIAVYGSTAANRDIFSILSP